MEKLRHIKLEVMQLQDENIFELQYVNKNVTGSVHVKCYSHKIMIKTIYHVRGRGEGDYM